MSIFSQQSAFCISWEQLTDLQSTHRSGLQHMGLDKEIKYGKKNFLILYFASAGFGTSSASCHHGNVGKDISLTGLVGSILAETLMVWHKLDERTRNMYTLDITVFGALMILLSYGQTVTCEFNKNIRDLPG
ncbi:hypothetical protein Esti_000243 [Eimeria stiedai]